MSNKFRENQSNPNKKQYKISFEDKINFLILLWRMFLLFNVYYEVAPASLRLLFRYYPQLEEILESGTALYAATFLIFSVIIIIDSIYEAIQSSLTAKSIPSDNILDAPDDL